MTDSFMTVSTDWENINPISVSWLPVTRVVDLFRLIDHAHTTNPMGSYMCVAAFLFMLFGVASISDLVVSHCDK